MENNPKSAGAEPLRISIVDDHAAFRLPVANYLELAGDMKVCISAASGPEFLNALACASILPQVGIVDISMSGMNGFVLVDRLNFLYPDFKILIVSGFIEPKYIEGMLARKVNGYLDKKSSPDEIRTALISIHTKGYYYNEVINAAVISLFKNKRITLPAISLLEMDLMRMCMEDLCNKQVAESLHRSVSSVNSAYNRLFKKFGVQSKVGLIEFALRYNYITLQSDANVE